jgi:hypothetical protein
MEGVAVVDLRWVAALAGFAGADFAFFCPVWVLGGELTEDCCPA